MKIELIIKLYIKKISLDKNCASIKNIEYIIEFKLK